MAKKITLADIAKILKKDKTKGDTSYWGVVQSKNTTIIDGKEVVTSYNVNLGGNTGTVKCRKLAGAEVGNTVLVTLRSTGEAIVVGTKNGDTDASDAKEAADTADGKATAAQGTANAAQQTASSAAATATSAYNKAAAVENHFWYDSNGAHVSLANPIASGTLNTLINAGGMSIRDGSTELAKFTDNLIELGKANNNASISFANGKGTIRHILGSTESDLEIYSSDGTKASKTIFLRPDPTDSSWDDYSQIIITSGNASSKYSSHGVFISNEADSFNSSSISVRDGQIIMSGLHSGEAASLKLADGKVKINNSELADFVTEQGTSSNWNYRKWKSGKKECWRTVTQSITKAGGSGPYYGNGSTVSFPSSFFSSAPMVQMSNSGSADGWLGTTSAATSSATGQPRFYRLGSWSGSVSVTLSIYAIGS